MYAICGCAGVEERGAPGESSADQAFKRAAAARLAEALTDDAARDQLLGALQRGPLALSELGWLTGELGAVAEAGAVPEVALRAPADGGDPARLAIAWAPGGDEQRWTAIPAYLIGGAEVALDPLRAPDAPVLVVETRGRLAMREDIEQANAALRRAGLQQAPSSGASNAASIQTTMLTSIRLADDKEPWISGAAEVYAIVSGVVGSNDPQLLIVDMPYLDNDGTTYAPNQLVINWSNFQFQVANIQLFEHDSNTNYQDLVSAIISAIGAAGSLAGFPVVQAVTEIANRIVAAIPAGVFTNDDDYVDSFYTIEQSRTYTGRVGASNNATISIKPFTVLPN